MLSETGSIKEIGNEEMKEIVFVHSDAVDAKRFVIKAGRLFVEAWRLVVEAG
jgi:hypothetical protein